MALLQRALRRFINVDLIDVVLGCMIVGLAIQIIVKVILTIAKAIW
jgi:hypothetical protein